MSTEPRRHPGGAATAVSEAGGIPDVLRRPLAPVPFEVKRIREDFPILRRKVRGNPLVYLDNAATSQKPQVVIDTVRRFYESENANIHRGVHYLSERATARFDQVRETVARFLNAPSSSTVIFTKGATEGINLVAQSYGRTLLQPGNEVLVTTMEHHSNIVPWQIVCQQTGAILRAVTMNAKGELELDSFQALLNERTRLVALTQVSNALGTINPVKRLVSLVHAVGAPVLIDAAQSVQHLPVDVQDLDCDFLVFSGHKVYGPTGVGVLYGRESLLEKMPPYQGGGDMIDSVSIEVSSWAPLPAKFEAGTPMIAAIMGLGSALEYVSEKGLEPIGQWEQQLLSYATHRLSAIDGVRLIGTAAEKASVLGFVLQGVHPHDIGTVLDDEGIAIRVGHHCAQPVMRHFGVPATARASFGLYNTMEEIDALADAVARVRGMFH